MRWRDSSCPERCHGPAVHVWDGDRKWTFQMHDWRMNALLGEAQGCWNALEAHLIHPHSRLVGGGNLELSFTGLSHENERVQPVQRTGEKKRKRNKVCPQGCNSRAWHEWVREIGWDLILGISVIEITT